MALLALAGCATPQEACNRYGFERGTTAYAKCLQTETIADREAWARVARGNR
jgi:hypothetical protein